MIGGGADGGGDLAIGVKGGVESAGGGVANQGEVIRCHEGVAADDDAAIGLHRNTVAAVSPSAEGGGDTAIGVKGGVEDA